MKFTLLNKHESQCFSIKSFLEYTYMYVEHTYVTQIRLNLLCQIILFYIRFLTNFIRCRANKANFSNFICHFGTMLVTLSIYTKFLLVKSHNKLSSSSTNISLIIIVSLYPSLAVWVVHWCHSFFFFFSIAKDGKESVPPK